MRRVSEVEHTCLLEYQAELERFLCERDAKTAVVSKAVRELIESPGACVIRGAIPKAGLFKRLLMKLGVEYSGAHVETAERLLDHRGRPWIKFLTVGIEIGGDFEFYVWLYSLFRRAPSIQRIVAEVSEIRFTLAGPVLS